MRRVALLLVVLAACSGGPDAPVTGSAENVCTEVFCLNYPSDWSVDEVGPDFVVFSHPEGGGAALASAGRIDPPGLIAATGGTWPQSVDVVIEAFWSLLADEGANLDGYRIASDGSVTSSGDFRDGRLWHRLIPLDGDTAIGVEVRGPNQSWSRHADVFTAGLIPLSGG